MKSVRILRFVNIINDSQILNHLGYAIYVETIAVNCSRDKTNLEKLINEQKIETLLQHAALKGSNAEKIDKIKDHSSKTRYFYIRNIKT